MAAYSRLTRPDMYTGAGGAGIGRLDKLELPVTDGSPERVTPTARLTDVEYNKSVPPSYAYGGAGLPVITVRKVIAKERTTRRIRRVRRRETERS